MFATSSAIGSIRLSGGASGSRRWALGDLVAPQKFIPSLALGVASVVRKLPESATLRNAHFSAGPLRVPVNRRGEFAIRWAGKGIAQNPYVYEVIDFDRVIAAGMAREAYDSGNGADAGVPLADLERFEREKFAGKIVLVGFTAAGFDIRSTPLQPAIPGIVTHANAIDNLVNDRFNRDANLALVCIALFAVAAAAGFFFYDLKSQVVATLLFLAVMAAWTALSYFSLLEGIIVPTAAPLSAFLLTFVGSTAAGIVAEQSRTKQLRGVFGKYVSPQVLEHILENPDRVELGGHRVELTILFSDIRGFTSISEASEPEEVVEMLNEYLTRMVEILLRYGGTLDKFIGDAVMGFWNAPTPDPEHALHAVQCAIDMVDETARLRAEWEKEGKPSLRIGVGINTGDAVVGNIGSQQVFGYTVIGDAVNLASRLESKNKDYGTEIIVSEFTRERIGDSIPTNYLDEVKVKGKEKAVKIYQVKGNLS
jgi:adenylate cyclase